MEKLLLSVLLMLSVNAFSQNLKCKDFKNGKFEIVDALTGNYIIERNGSKQIEFGEESKLKLEFKVTWLNDCSYTLELTKIIENPYNFQLPEDMILRVDIIETKENSYIQKTSSNQSDVILESEMIKIEKNI